MRIGQQVVGLSVHHLHVVALHELPIVITVNAGRSRYDHRVVGAVLRSLEHGGQVVFDFLSAASAEQRHDGLLSRNVVELVKSVAPLVGSREETVHLLLRRIAHVVNRVMVLALEEAHLEGQNREELIHIAANVLDAILLPGPYLRRNIVVDRTQPLLLHILGDVEIEARIVNEYHHVGAPLGDVLLAFAHVAQNGGQMQQHGHEAHVGQLAVVLHASAPLGRHQVAAEEAELSRRVGILQRPHQPRRMQVAAGLSCYQVVFHRSRRFGFQNCQSRICSSSA